MPRMNPLQFSADRRDGGMELRLKLHAVTEREQKLCATDNRSTTWTMWPWIITIFVLIVSTDSRTLDLSNRKLKREDFFLKIQPQLPLHETVDLILRGNLFDSFLDCSTNLSNIRTLDLSQNHLQRFYFLCKDEYNLQVLNISHNMLEYIDEQAFNNRIPKLMILDLSWNKLSVVNETMLEHFNILEYLSLASNPISDRIHESALWNLKALRYLNLSNISASYFTSGLFKTLNNLSTLDLSLNPIRIVPLLPANIEELDLSGTRVSRLQDLTLPRLRELNLRNMQDMKELILNDLGSLMNLELLSLDGSKNLLHLRMNLHEGRLLPRLQRLSLSNCGLKTLDYNLMSVIKRIPILNLENNAWHCDCKMQWLNMLDETKTISREIKCQSPELNVGKQLSEVPNYDLICKDSSMFYPILWASILVLLVVIILAMAFFALKQPLGHWNIRRKNRNTVTYTNVDETSNDMVRILAIGETLERNDE